MTGCVSFVHMDKPYTKYIKRVKSETTKIIFKQSIWGQMVANFLEFTKWHITPLIHTVTAQYNGIVWAYQPIRTWIRMLNWRNKNNAMRVEWSEWRNLFKFLIIPFHVLLIYEGSYLFWNFYRMCLYVADWTFYGFPYEIRHKNSARMMLFRWMEWKCVCVYLMCPNENLLHVLHFLDSHSPLDIDACQDFLFSLGAHPHHHVCLLSPAKSHISLNVYPRIWMSYPVDLFKMIRVKGGDLLIWDSFKDLITVNCCSINCVKSLTALHFYTNCSHGLQFHYAFTSQLASSRFPRYFPFSSGMLAVRKHARGTVSWRREIWNNE